MCFSPDPSTIALDCNPVEAQGSTSLMMEQPRES